jgi:hypothetical protein
MVETAQSVGQTKIACKLKNSGQACKPDSVRRKPSRACSVTIIPLVPASRLGSSDLPEGSSFRAAYAAHKGARSFKRSQRAGPALPSYLVLHHAGFALPPPLLPERWALTPPFHPYLRRVPFEDIPKVFLRAITGIRFAGGIFSVALSVMRLLSCRIPWRYQARCPTLRFAKWCPDFPPAQPAFADQASDHPAHPPLLV